MKFVRKFLFVTGGIVLLLLAAGVFLPATARTVHSIEIDAPAATVFSLLNDFRQVRKWSSRMAADPNARYIFEGPQRGTAAVIRWDGQIIGKGSQVIVESVPYERISSDLDLGDGNTTTSNISLVASDSGTRVTWSLEQHYGINLTGRYLGLMLGSIVGTHLDTSLQNLKSMAERLPRADFSDLPVEHVNVEANDIAVLSASSAPDARAISEATGEAYFSILKFIDVHGLREAGAPIIISRGYSGSEITFDAAIPVRGAAGVIPGPGEQVKLGKSYAGPVIRTRHLGSYATLGQTHDKIAAYLAALGIQRGGDPWESYVSDPARTAESDLVTYVYYPVK